MTTVERRAGRARQSDRVLDQFDGWAMLPLVSAQESELEPTTTTSSIPFARPTSYNGRAGFRQVGSCTA